MASARTGIIAGISANIAIAAAKLAGYFFTGSSAMLSEAIHSFVDTGNGALLLLGQKRGKLPPDEEHPFGHGKELYFWSLIVALLIFVLGGGISIAEGIDHIRHPAPSQDPTWAYAILGISLCVEGYALFVAVREFRALIGDVSLLEGIRVSKDPSAFTIIFEDTAALLGLIFAFSGIFLGHTFGWPRADGIASVLIGLLLITVAVLLIMKCKTLLVGEGAEKAILIAIRGQVLADPDVDTAGYPFTMYFGPHNILLTMNLQFRSGISAEGIEAAVDRIEAVIKGTNPDIQRIYLEVDSLRSHDRDPAAHAELTFPT